MNHLFEPTRVLCALDLEQPIDGLLETATSIVERFGATLHLIHVWVPSVAMMPEGAMIPSTSELDTLSTQLGEQLEAIAETLRLSHEGVTATLVPGTPWHEIVTYAEANDCDLIVAGTHGRTGIARLVEGSVAERVVRASSVPVLVVPIHKAAEVVRAKSSPLTDTEDVWSPQL